RGRQRRGRTRRQLHRRPCRRPRGAGGRLLPLPRPADRGGGPVAGKPTVVRAAGRRPRRRRPFPRRGLDDHRRARCRRRPARRRLHPPAEGRRRRSPLTPRHGVFATMANVTVIGAQWGDEGKGKIVDWLASKADVVVRFQGGHNAGHTLVVGNQTYKLSLLPSGIVTGTLSIIGNGVVLDPWALKAEIERLEGQGVSITPENFAVADNSPLILPLHRDLD